MSFLDSFQKLWKTWDLRSFLLFSFSLQCILILTASMRKRTSNKVWIALIWLTYLCADWSAYYAIGLIPSPKTNACEHDKYADLHAFWAPFFLLHIGGPTTIAGFSLEDNETWRRSILHLLAQAGLTLFIIYQAIIPHYRNPLLAPTLFMFVAAVTRYLERVLALYYASTNKFRNSAIKDLNYGKDFESLCRTPSRDRLNEVQMVKDSCILFQSYKRVFGGLPITDDNSLIQSKHYLLKVLAPEEACREMEIQMNLAYDFFYTKTWLIVETKVGMILHMVSLCSELVALVLWSLVDKEKYLLVDVRLTNTLVLGGIAVDVLSCFKLIFSDIMISKLAKLKWVGDSYLLSKAVLAIKRLEFRRWLVFSRWSQTTPQFNLVHDFILKGHHKHNNWDDYLICPNRSVKYLSRDVKRHVINHIMIMADYANSQGKAKIICSEIGLYMHQVYNWKELKAIMTRAGFVDALLVCHLATELLYKEDRSYKSNVAVQLSEYLMCILVDKPRVVDPEGVEIMTAIMSEERHEHLRKIYEGEAPRLDDVEEALNRLVSAKGDTTRSMLKYSHYIKDQLKKLQKIHAIDILEDIWVELLCHMAIKCSAWAHLEQLSSGGELLTIVWLLMRYVGLTTKFEPQEDDDNNHHNNITTNT